MNLPVNPLNSIQIQNIQQVDPIRVGIEQKIKDTHAEIESLQKKIKELEAALKHFPCPYSSEQLQYPINQFR